MKFWTTRLAHLFCSWPSSVKTISGIFVPFDCLLCSSSNKCLIWWENSLSCLENCLEKWENSLSCLENCLENFCKYDEGSWSSPSWNFFQKYYQWKNKNQYFFSRFPLRLTENFCIKLDDWIWSLINPTCLSFPQLLPKFTTEPSKIRHFQNSESIFEETIDLIFLKMIFS